MPRRALGMEARDDGDEVRGWDDGMRERLEVDGVGRELGSSPVDGRAGKVEAPFPGGLAIGCSGLTGRPSPVPGGGTTTTLPGG